MTNDNKERTKQASEDFVRGLLAPTPGYIDWRAPNRWTLGIFGLAFTVAACVSPDFVGSPAWAMLIGVCSSLARTVTRVYAIKIEEFVPRTPLEAKRANEQIKSLATAINGLAAGGALAMVVPQMTAANPDAMIIIAATGLAIWIHTGARNLLGLLKDENMQVEAGGPVGGA